MQNKKCNHEKTIKKGTCAQEGKKGKRKIKNNSPCLLEGEWKRKCQFKEKIFLGTMFAATSNMACFRTLKAPKWVFLNRGQFWHYAFQSSQRKILSIFQKTHFLAKIQAAPPKKHKKTRRGAPKQQNICLPIFSRSPGFWGLFHRKFFRPANLKKNPFSPQFSGHVRPRLIQTRKKVCASHRSESGNRPSPEASFAACRSKTTPAFFSGASCGNCCALAYPQKTL